MYAQNDVCNIVIILLSTLSNRVAGIMKCKKLKKPVTLQYSCMMKF